MSTVMSRKEVIELAEGIDDLKIAMEQGYDVSKELTTATKEAVEAQKGLTEGEKAGVQATKTFTSIMTNWNTAFDAAADLTAKNIDELVDLYNAQITMIRTQNIYTQAIALQSAAVGIYGKQSEQATRATVAANYVGALYEQSKKNEVVAANAYVTATGTNVAKIASSIMDTASSVSQFLVAFAIYRAAHTAAQAQLEEETTAVVVDTTTKEAQTAAQIAATTAAEADTAAQTELAVTEAAGAATAGAGGAMGILSDLEYAAPTLLDFGFLAMQHGGFVPKTGPYVLHAGETVVSPEGKVSGVPASTMFAGGGSGGSSMPNVEIHIHASSNVDLARVRMEVEAALAKTLLASQKQRGVY